MMVLSSGCLCCNLRGDLVTALEKLLRNLDNGRASFKRVIVETTGLADPAPLLQTLMSHPYLVMRFRLDGVVTLVDAVNGVQHARQSSRSGETGRGRRSSGADQERSARSGRRSGQARRPDRAAAQAQSGSADPRCGRRRGPRSTRHHRLRTLRPRAQDPGCSAAGLRTRRLPPRISHGHHHHHDVNRHDDAGASLHARDRPRDPCRDARPVPGTAAFHPRAEPPAHEGDREYRGDAGPADGPARRAARAASRNANSRPGRTTTTAPAWCSSSATSSRA